ncbi:glycosyltransferase family 4 protein [Brumimicrobium mesophilum]|uniref:glycosyltransferase family 4 protein n=1 Tax=Brumimicrobium mesophilum TaxID=392717 RepID=UPI000D13F038|nr:glycosyltransferase family 4 protein [Brumimicrobium mesophilum]
MANSNILMLLDNEFTSDMRVENEVMSLSKSGFNVTVLCLNHGDQKPTEDFYGAKIIRIPVSLFKKNKMKGLGNTPFDFWISFWYKHIKKVATTQDIHFIHANDLYMLPPALKARRKLRTKPKVVADLHENYPEALKNYRYTQIFPGKYIISIPKWEASEVKWLKEADAMITVIEEAKDRYQNLGIESSKINVVPNYVNMEHFNVADIDQNIVDKFEGFMTLTYIGGFDYHRGLESVISSIPEIIKSIPNFKLILVGAGSNKEELIELAEKLDVSKYVSFEGWQPPATLSSYLKATNIGLIPHLKSKHTDNTIPHKLFQYMLLERPIISSNCNPLERIITKEECGLIYESNNSEQLAEKVIQLLKDEELQAKMGAKGHEAVLKTYNWDAAAISLVNIYK